MAMLFAKLFVLSLVVAPEPAPPGDEQAPAGEPGAEHAPEPGREPEPPKRPKLELPDSDDPLAGL